MMFNLHEFERSWSDGSLQKWMQTNWYQSIIYAAVYLVLIYMGQAFMKHHKAFELRTALVAWNACHALFSLCGTVRVVPILLYKLTIYGFVNGNCHQDVTVDQGVHALSAWLALFVLSKVVELGDTVFIVLRKQKLIFLHWYHHASVLIYAWFVYAEYSSPGLWFYTLNYIAHSCMYTYYLCRALRIKLHITIAMTVTLVQISQLILGLFIVIFTVYLKYFRGIECRCSHMFIAGSLVLYGSYLIMFIDFFQKAYFGRSIDVGSSHAVKFMLSKLNRYAGSGGMKNMNIKNHNNNNVLSNDVTDIRSIFDRLKSE